MPPSPETVAAVAKALLQGSQVDGDAEREVEVIVGEVEEAVRWLASEEGLRVLKEEARAALAVDEAEEAEEVPVQRSLTVTGAVKHMYNQTNGDGDMSLGERVNEFFLRGDENGHYSKQCSMTVVFLWPMLVGMVLLPLLGVPPLVDWSHADTPGLHWLLVAGAVACGFSLFSMSALGFHFMGREVSSLGHAVKVLGEGRAAMVEAAQRNPGLLTPRTSLLLVLVRVVLTGAAVAVEVFDIAANDDFTFGPLGDAISGVYMLGEALLAGYAAAYSPLSWALAHCPFATPLIGLCPYVLPTGVVWGDQPFAGQLLLSPLSVLLAPVFAALQWVVVGVRAAVRIAWVNIRDAAKDVNWIIKWPVLVCIVFPLFMLQAVSSGVFFAAFACAGAIFPVLLVFIGPSMISAGSIAQGVASTSLCANILITHLSGHGVAAMLLGLDAGKTAQLAVLYTILAGWCGYLLLQQASHGLSTPALMKDKYGRVPKADARFVWVVLCFEWLLLLGGLPTLLASSMVWMPDDGCVVRAFCRMVGVGSTGDSSEAGDASSSRVELQRAAGAAGDDRA